IYGTDISLPSTSRKEFFLYVYPQGAVRKLTVSVLDGGKTLAKTNLNISCEQSDGILFGVYADDPTAYNILNDIRPLTGLTRVAQLKTADLPDRAQGWDALDALVISNIDTGTLTPEQKKSLELWLANGGKLFVTGGLRWQMTTAGLHDFLPVELTSTKNVAGLPALSAYIKDPSLLEQETILATGQLGDGANILVEQDDIPLLIEKQIGFGKVFYFAADPNLQPLSNWDGMKKIYDHLLAFKSPRPLWADAVWDPYQANNALATLPELALPSFVYVCCWLGIYILIIGPVNYLILRRIKRTELAWVTVPVLVILFSCLAYFSGYAYRGTRPILNRFQLGQGWDGVEQAQVNALIGIYSPNRTTYNMETQNHFMAYPPQGVYDNLQGNDNWLSLKNEIGTSMPGVRVDIGAMQAVGMEGSMPALTVQHDLVITINNKEPILTGNITNTSNYMLRDAVLVTPSGWIKIGDLSKNKTEKVDYVLTNTSRNPLVDMYAILGLNNYSYPQDDVEYRRRYSFFQANTTSTDSYVNMNSGIYLMGWVDEIPAPVGLQDQDFESIDTMLYFEMLTPAVKTEAGSLMLTSSIYGWESSLGDTITAQNQFSEDGYTVRFQPSLPVHFSEVDSLTLHIESNVTPDKIQASLWNVAENTWMPIPLSISLLDSDTDIPDAWQYVGTDGEIRLKLDGDQNDYIMITSVNFTLMVQP
ncbi:MAG: hypothetical protein MUO77_06060, partial [Anaerolineales bacterium]|nr:hypothetical protein [Anaerolineales bacterium]